MWALCCVPCDWLLSKVATIVAERDGDVMSIEQVTSFLALARPNLSRGCAALLRIKTSWSSLHAIATRRKSLG
jgi:hypothetical protein